MYSIERTRTKPNAKSDGVFTSKTTSTTHDLTTKKRENLHIFFSVFPRLIVTRKLKIIVRSKESLNHSFLFDLNWCQIKRKREKRKRGWLYWPKSLKDKFFSCFHLYPYIILYVSMLLLGLFPFFFLYSSSDDNEADDDHVDDDESKIHDIHIKINKMIAKPVNTPHFIVIKIETTFYNSTFFIHYCILCSTFIFDAFYSHFYLIVGIYPKWHFDDVDEIAAPFYGGKWSK